MGRQLSTLCWACLFTVASHANNIQVGPVSLIVSDPLRKIAFLEFSLQWENSWKTSSNHDAAWVFAKFSFNGEPWQHLHFSREGHENISEIPVNLQPEHHKKQASYHPVHNPVVGFLVHRSTPGTGTLNIDKISLRWDYGFDAIDSPGELSIRLFAIEMVYVPEGPFYLGDGISSGTFRLSNANQPILIGDFPVVLKCEDTSYDDPQLEGSGIWVHGKKGISTNSDNPTDINPDFPLGYRSFYCMKYEVSQQQYADFLNTLAPGQAAARTYTAGGSRHNIILSGGHFQSSSPHLPNNWMSWADALAYADWAALRPLSETEYEKACRGFELPVAGAFAWGNTTIANSHYLLREADEASENTINRSAVSGNCVYDQTYTAGPLRTGIFALEGDNNRTASGASVWGIMELSGNLAERCVSLGSAEGRSFTQQCGDGALDNKGSANVPGWPGNTSGFGFRGGSWAFGGDFCRISDRTDATSAFAPGFDDTGFRAGR